MKTPNKKTRTAKQHWPFIKRRIYPNGTIGWSVDTRTATGGERRTFTTQAEAETFAAQSRVRRTNDGNSAFGNADLARYGKTVSDAVTFYLGHLRQQEKSVPVAAAVAELIEMKVGAKKSTRYCKDLGLRLGRFCKTHGERSVASISGKELDAWLAGLAVAPGTQNTFRRDLRTLFSFCTKRDYCATDPAKRTERAEDVDKPPGILTPRQSSALLTAAGNDVLPYIAIGLFAGLRAAELEKLDWQEVNLQTGFIEVTAAKSKTKKRRLVPISENLAAWIRPLAATAGPVAPVGLRKRFDAVKEHAGLAEWPQNALRHSYGTYRLATTADAARVSLEMGNSPQMVFGHYRELVTPATAATFWQIAPAPAKGGRKIVAMKAA